MFISYCVSNSRYKSSHLWFSPSAATVDAHWSFSHTLHVKLFLGERPKLHPMHPSVYESVLNMHGVKRCFNAASTSYSAGVSKHPCHMTTAN